MGQNKTVWRPCCLHQEDLDWLVVLGGPAWRWGEGRRRWRLWSAWWSWTDCSPSWTSCRPAATQIDTKQSVSSQQWIVSYSDTARHHSEPQPAWPAQTLPSRHRFRSIWLLQRELLQTRTSSVWAQLGNILPLTSLPASLASAALYCPAWCC